MKNNWPSIADIVKSVKNQTVSAEENVAKSLSIIKEKNDEYNAIISLIEERAVQRAKKIDEEIMAGKDVGRLAGVPFIAKDNFLTFGSETTASSNMLKGFMAPYQSTAIEKLEAEGAICVGKANMDAFAHGGSTENSDFGVTKNPHDIERVPGGSSGGSAAAVALGMAPFALGTDTGGSIRQPASFCGVVGYKPSYGLVSRNGVVAMASSTDTIGPLANSIEDTSLILDVIAGKDELDGTTIERNNDGYIDLKGSLKGKKVGLIKEFLGNGLNEETKKNLDESIAKLKNSGVDVNEVSIPSMDLALAIYYIVVPAELSSNLARHDGQRYQLSIIGESLEDTYELSRTGGFGNEAKRRIMIGTHVLSSGYYDAYYKKAQTVRTKLINEINKVFEEYDFIIGPVTPSTAFKIGENVNDPIQMYLQDVMTVGASLSGIPAISIPNGKDSKNLPTAVQIMAQYKKDRELLEFAKIAEEIL